MLHESIKFKSFSQTRKPFILKRLGVLILLTYGFLQHSHAQQLKKIDTNNNQSEIIIESENQSSNSTNRVFTAYGNVRIVYPEKGIVATSRQVQFLKDEGIVVLTGDVDVIRDGINSLHGERVVFFLEDDKLIVDSQSGSQVLLKLILESDKLNDGTSDL